MVDQVTESVTGLGAAEPLPIPVFPCSGVKAASNGLEYMLTFSTMVPAATDDGVAVRPIVALTLTRGTASDLLIVLKEIIEKVDADFGAVDTPYQKEQREAAK